MVYRKQFTHTLTYDMTQPTEYRNPLSIPQFRKRASAEPLLDSSKWASLIEMAKFEIDGMVEQNLLAEKLAFLESTDSTYEIGITGEIETQKRNSEIQKQEKISWKNKNIVVRLKALAFVILFHLR